MSRCPALFQKTEIRLTDFFQLDHVNFPQKKENVKKLVDEGEEQEDFKPFPTLVEALSKVDPDVGFNVEVKYPMMQSVSLLKNTSGEGETSNPFLEWRA